MQVIANAGGRTLVVVPLARPTAEKRRSLNRDAHSSKDCISKKAAPPASPVASGELSEAEAIQRARHGRELGDLFARFAAKTQISISSDATPEESYLPHDSRRSTGRKLRRNVRLDCGPDR